MNIVNIDSQVGGDNMHRSSQQSKNLWKLGLYLSLLFAILAACGGGQKSDNPGGDGYVTWTPSQTATPTCEPNISLSTPEGWGYSTRLIVILYDPGIRDDQRIIGEQYLELANGEKTQDIPQFISRIVPGLMRHGDQASIFYMGYSSYEDARVARLNSYLSPPQLYNTPAPRATLTSLPPTITPEYGYGGVATKQAARMEATARAGTEIANQAIYACEVNFWNNIIEVTAIAWNSTATAEIFGISNDLDAALMDVSKGKGKPFQLTNFIMVVSIIV